MENNPIRYSKEEEKLALNIKFSLEATIKGLTLFVNSFEKSGLRESIPSYIQLRNTLIQQRLWSVNQSRSELQPLWEGIAKQSSLLYDMIYSLCEIMNELKMIDKTNSSSKDEKNYFNNEDYARILNYLKKPRFVSLYKLSQNIGEERSKTLEKANVLVKQGLIEKRGRGRGISYRLK